MKIHTVADLFPMMNADEYRELVEDISVNGLKEPIWTYDNQIIDGRNRYKACVELAIEPKFRSLTGSKTVVELVNFVVSLNLKRRHLNGTQKAFVSLEIEKMLAIDAKSRQRLAAGDHKSEEYKKSVTPTLGEVIQERNESARQVAKIVGVSHGYVSDAKKIESKSPEVARIAKSGVISMETAKEIIKLSDEKQKSVINQIESGTLKAREVISKVIPHVLHNNGENEWYTPIEYIKAARLVTGGIDLDPATSELANRTVEAKNIYTIENNGLLNIWFGKVWMNPPYSQPDIQNFCTKLYNEFVSGNVNQACVLVNNATETKWFKILLDISSSVCLIQGRIKFIDPNGNPSGSPLQGQIVCYIGANVSEFNNQFSEFGKILYATWKN